MTSFDDRDRPDDRELAAADRMDAEITALLAGRTEAGTADPGLVRLTNEFRVDPPASTYAAVDRRVRAPGRRWLWAQVAAIVLGVVVVIHGLSTIVFGEWISESLGEPFSHHAMVDGGLGYIAIGAAFAIAGTRRRWLPVAVFAGVPFGLIMGGRGLHEIGTFAWGAVAHGAIGVAAIVLLVTYVLIRRYGRDD